MSCPICSSTNVLAMSGSWNSRCGSCGWTWDDPSRIEFSVPDEIGEVEAWRAWDIIETPDGLRIASQGYGGANACDVWNPGEVLHAKCGNGKPHRAPDEGCTCGFYAARTREHLVSLRAYHLTTKGWEGGTKVVMGRVFMDGKVVPATLGFRGENIWPVEIIVPFQWWKIVPELQESYGEWGVNVHLENTQKLPERDHVQWCGKCGRKIPPREATCKCGALAA